MSNPIPGLRLISGADRILIPPTSGKRVIIQCKDVFRWIDPNFATHASDQGEPETREVLVEIYEMVADLTTEEIFKSTERSLGELCFTEDQVASFVGNHPDRLKKDGCGTFLLFRDDDAYFVAYVYAHPAGGFNVDKYPLSLGGIWNACKRCRVVLPRSVAPV